MCSLQTSPSKFTRVVGFVKKNTRTRATIQQDRLSFEVGWSERIRWSAVHNSTTSIIQVNATDLNFGSKPPQYDATTCINNLPETVAANITLAEMQKLTQYQRVNVTGVVTLGALPPK